MTFDEFADEYGLSEDEGMRSEYRDAYNAGAADLVKQRDAAFKMSRCECEGNECCRNLMRLHDRIAELEKQRGDLLAALELLELS